MNLSTDEQFMTRCLELALQGAGYTAPNPMVGAVLVYEGRIIGEGYHERYGQAHAEVNCLRSVKPEDLDKVSRSTIYVSLEPCAHFGKTPPCADLIIDKRIRRVVVGCRDPFKEVDGKGIEKLRAAGVSVEVGVMEKECRHLNRRFFTFHTLHRPYIVLKWAQSANRKIAAYGGKITTELMAGQQKESLKGAVTGALGEGLTGMLKEGPAGPLPRTLITNEYTNRVVHRWRSEEAGILVGTNTAMLDDPGLTARLWSGPDPVRLVIDKSLRLPSSLQIFDGKVRTIVFTIHKHEMDGNPGYYQLTTDSSLVQQIVHALYQLNIQSVLVEGGAQLLQSFIEEGYWDEARVITNNELEISEGLPAPVLHEKDLQPDGLSLIFSDTLRYYINSLSLF